MSDSARGNHSVPQMSYAIACDLVRGVLQDALAHSASSDRIGSVPYRATAALYGLLMDHPIDRRGRCRSCRRPGGVIGLRRRRCRVHRTAHFYLHHPDGAFLFSHLASEVGLSASAVPEVSAAESVAATAPEGDWDGTEQFPEITAEPNDPSTTSQSPVVSSPPFLPGGFPRTGRPDSDHGEAGESPDDPRFRRGPSGAGSPPARPGSLVLTGVVA